MFKVQGRADEHANYLQGYFLAAYLYMTIVFVLPLAAGVLALALDLPVSVDEAYGGLILPASAYVIMGKSGEGSRGAAEAPASSAGRC
jgi:hypothetical protein